MTIDIHSVVLIQTSLPPKKTKKKKKKKKEKKAFTKEKILVNHVKAPNLSTLTRVKFQNMVEVSSVFWCVFRTEIPIHTDDKEDKDSQQPEKIDIQSEEEKHKNCSRNFED